MTKKITTTLVLLLAVLLTSVLSGHQPVSAAQTIPYKINFQGRLTDNNGNIVANGSYNIKFTIYNASTGGSNLWQEFRQTTNRVTVTNGLFDIRFGDVTALSPTLFDDSTQLYLEVELPTPATATCNTSNCGTFTEGPLSPRQPIAASPYAFNADMIDGIDGASLAQLGTTNTFTASNNFTGGLQRSGNNVCDTSNNCSYAATSGSTNYIQNTTTPQTANIAITSAALGSVGISVRAAGGQTADLIQVRNDSNIVVSKFENDGDLTLGASGFGGTLNLGSASSTQGLMRLYNDTNSNAVSVTAGVTSSAYTLTLPTAVGASGDCLKTSNGTGALTFGACASGGVSLQGSTPGSAQTGNLNISGTGIFGTEVQSPSFKTSGAMNFYAQGESTAQLNLSTGFGIRTAQLNSALTIATPNAGISGLVIDGAASQTSDLLQLRNSSSAVLAVFDNNGQLKLGRGSGLTGSLTLQNSTNNNTAAIQSGTTSASYTLTLPTAVGASGDCLKTSNGTGALTFGSCAGGGVSLQGSTPGTADTGNLNITGTGIFGTEVQSPNFKSSGDSNFYSNGHATPYMTFSNGFGLRTAAFNAGFTAQSSNAALTAMAAKGAASHTANIFEIRNSSDTVLSAFDKDGQLHIGHAAANSTATLLTLDDKNTAGDPTGADDGAMYYNSDSKNFRCKHNALWQDCDFASLRAEWVMQEDFVGGGTTTQNIGTHGWQFTATGVGTFAKTSVGGDASDQGRFGVVLFGTPATAASGSSIRGGVNSMAGVPSNMVAEFDFAPVLALAAAGLQQTIRIGFHDSTSSAAPTDGIYFQYNTTTAAGNWFRCTQTTCVDTGVARTTTANQYQRFKIQTNSAGTAVEFFINEASVGTASTNLPGASAAYDPAMNAHTVDAAIRSWKTDYFQIKRNLSTLR